MDGGTPSVVELLKARIGNQGSISFAEFMQAALYEPGHGYYCREEMTTGPDGDYFTSPDVSPAFGRLIARQVVEIAQRAGCHDGVFHLIEAGPGTGTLARDLAAGLSEEAPALAARTVTTLVEISPALARAQQRRLKESGSLLAGIRWAAWKDLIEGRLDAGGPFSGCVIANEFLDALPVHMVQVEQGRLHEVRVAWRDGAFVEDLARFAPARLQDHFDRLASREGIELADGQRAEAGLAALDWVSSLGALFGSSGRGGALLVDYGHPARELYSSARHRGSLLCYRRHQALDDPFAGVGHQDMTAHVDFSSVAARARAAGFDVAGPVTQMKFLVSLGLAQMLAESARLEGSRGVRERLALHQLMAPGGMGEVFKALLMTRGTPAGSLTGAQDPFRGAERAAAAPAAARRGDAA